MMDDDFVVHDIPEHIQWLFAKTFKCCECGHEQEVRPTAIEPLPDGQVACYYGSSTTFCDKCDGIVVEQEPTIH